MGKHDRLSDLQFVNGTRAANPSGVDNKVVYPERMCVMWVKTHYSWELLKLTRKNWKIFWKPSFFTRSLPLSKTNLDPLPCVIIKFLPRFVLHVQACTDAGIVFISSVGLSVFVTSLCKFQELDDIDSNRASEFMLVCNFVLPFFLYLNKHVHV